MSELIKMKVLSFLAYHRKPITIKELSREIHSDFDNVKEALKDLKEEGLVSRGKINKKWKLNKENYLRWRKRR